MDGKRIAWYTCGPTVYDSSHMGHARTYLAFDIVRRILRDYFQYDVFQVMNITDIDDKIITRSNERGIEFTELARRYEAEYLADMAALGVSPPDALTRVSEYVPEVIEFIQGIIDAGYAYASNGSVYFDVAAYQATGKQAYGKLVPENVGDAGALAEGEGALAAGTEDKRNPVDFALWKASKPGEPKWPSPWGEGRPGWHIECSAMATAVLKPVTGGVMDMHTGGIDLRFPHHDNEIAQSEACNGGKQWVNYFLHSGHLHIHGLKMAKSLKNFITIQAALETYSPRLVRLLFLNYKYNSPMNYSDETMSHMQELDKALREFFANVKAALRGVPVASRQHWDEPEHAMAAQLRQTQAAVHAALLDDFDTPIVMRALRELMTEVNKYMSGESVNPLVLRSAAEYITRMLRVFGLDEVDGAPLKRDVSKDSELTALAGANIGWAGNAGGASREEQLTPLLDALTEFRSVVRSAGRAKDLAAVLTACDQLRDEVLPLLGVRLEDTATDSTWKLEDPQVILAELAAKKAAAEEAAARKAAAKEEAARKAAEKEARAKVSPAEWLRTRTADDGTPLYSAWDEAGMPTHDAAGEELSKAARKGAAKEWKAQEKLHSKWLATQGSAAAAAAPSE